MGDTLAPVVAQATALYETGSVDAAIEVLMNAKKYIRGSNVAQATKKKMLDDQAAEWRAHLAPSLSSSSSATSASVNAGAGGVAVGASGSGTTANTVAPTVLTDAQKVPWDAIVGLDELVAELRQWVELPRRQPQLSKDDVRGKSALFYGCPGVGKSLMSRAVATACDGAFFDIDSKVVNMYQGESERLIREAFAAAARSAETTTTVLFMDEMDGFLRKRESGEQDSTRRIKTTFLTSFETAILHKKLIIIGATNMPEELDDAIQRRFDNHIYIPPPSREGRRAWFAKALPEFTEADVETLVAQTNELWTGSDMARWVRSAQEFCRADFRNARQFYKMSDGSYVVDPEDAEGGDTQVVETVPCVIQDVPEGLLLPHRMRLYHMAAVRLKNPPTTSREKLRQFEAYADRNMPAT